MTSYNVNFELSVEDVELIETALRLTKQELSNEQLVTDAPAHDETLRRIQDLLGRMHNQKVFYRPRAGAYIGG
ncbi:hypothetical protein [uncultured Roseovarius sp.]|uniref:hypothetical protein n=1 Tax=uncultured Roseovarius sp. TaxID=293344 RepID=UPI0026251420|nr:hypothetical protein [uncultured Roseovarius sp.]